MRAVVLFVLAVSVIGCGKSLDPPEPVYPVSGVITFQGMPLAGADVTFHNLDKRRSAFGRTNDRGEYRLTTFSMNDGAVEGRAVLTVIKVLPPTITKAAADTESEAYQPPGEGVSDSPTVLTSGVPPRYASSGTSGLVANINRDGPNELNFDLSL